MKYELAKQLKEAGFPQPGLPEGVHGRDAWEPFKPTLSELISACGEEFYSLEKDLTSGVWRWRVFKRGEFQLPRTDGVYWGDTPESAVASLWLELNKNEQKV